MGKMSHPILRIKDLTVSFGGVVALNNFDMDLFEGEILGIMGPNGAGKTTLFNAITGFCRPRRGKIIYKGTDITGLKPNRIAKKGLARGFQANLLFKERPVIENVIIAHHLQAKAGIFDIFLNGGFARKDAAAIRQKAREMLQLMGLDGFEQELAGALPHGYKRRLGICMMLAANPSLALLDEPVTGMSLEEAAGLLALIKGIRDRGLTFVIVEHNVKALVNICDRIVVIHYGRKIATGTPREILRDAAVIDAYLGTEVED